MMTTPPLTHTVEGLMALVKSFGDIEILHAIGKVSSFERQKALEDVQSYAVWLVDATAVDAAAEALKAPSLDAARLAFLNSQDGHLYDMLRSITYSSIEGYRKWIDRGMSEYGPGAKP